MSVITAVIGAGIGAVVTVAVGQFLRRARPVIVIDEITLSTSTIPEDAVVVPNLHLVSRVGDDPFLQVNMPAATGEQRITERQYVKYLKDALEQTDAAIETLPITTEVAHELSNCLGREDYPAFEALFSRELVRLWPAVFGAHARGQFEYAPPADGREPAPAPAPVGVVQTAALAEQPAADVEHSVHDPFPVVYRDDRAGVEVWRGSGFAHEIAIDAAGDFFMPLAGPRNLVFYWSTASPAQLRRMKAFALRTAVAFAKRCKPDLQSLVNFLMVMEDLYQERLVSLRRDLREELAKHERIQLKGIVGNRGGSGFSVTNWATLFVLLDGYSYTARDGGNRNLQVYSKDEEIEIRVGGEEGEDGAIFETPLAVQAGSLVRFVATSTAPVRSLPYADILLGAMTSGDRKCYAGMMIVAAAQRFGRFKPTRSHLNATYTSDHLFRDSRSYVRVPPRGRSDDVPQVI